MTGSSAGVSIGYCRRCSTSSLSHLTWRPATCALPEQSLTSTPRRAGPRSFAGSCSTKRRLLHSSPLHRLWILTHLRNPPDLPRLPTSTIRPNACRLSLRLTQRRNTGITRAILPEGDRAQGAEMRRLRHVGWIAVVLSAGCVSGPQAENPLWLRPGVTGHQCENPVLIAPGPAAPGAYEEAFEKVLDVVDDYFEIAYANRYDGRIVGVPHIAPGYEQPWKPGSPDHHERLLATLQTYRHRCFVQIRPADQGGFLVQVTVYKELKDDDKPSIPSSGSAAFRDFGTVDRTFEVVDPTLPITPGERWIPKGQDHALEQAILKKIQRCQ